MSIAERRRPHPDPRIEAQLQRILSMQAMIARQHELITRDHEQITSLRAKVEKRPHWTRAPDQRKQVERLLAEIRQVEAEILKLHDKIEARMNEISDADLSAL